MAGKSSDSFSRSPVTTAQSFTHISNRAASALYIYIYIYRHSDTSPPGQGDLQLSTNHSAAPSHTTHLSTNHTSPHVTPFNPIIGRHYHTPIKLASHQSRGFAAKSILVEHGALMLDSIPANQRGRSLQSTNQQGAAASNQPISARPALNRPIYPPRSLSRI